MMVADAYQQKVFDIIHPTRRNLSAIRGYKRLGGLPDDPRTDPQDRSWYGPHDRLFTEEESELLEFRPGPEYGSLQSPLPILIYMYNSFALCSVVLGLGRRR